MQSTTCCRLNDQTHQPVFQHSCCGKKPIATKTWFSLLYRNNFEIKKTSKKGPCKPSSTSYFSDKLLNQRRNASQSGVFAYRSMLVVRGEIGLRFWKFELEVLKSTEFRAFGVLWMFRLRFLLKYRIVPNSTKFGINCICMNL